MTCVASPGRESLFPFFHRDGKVPFRVTILGAVEAADLGTDLHPRKREPETTREGVGRRIDDQTDPHLSSMFGGLALLPTFGCSSTQTVGEELDDATITTRSRPS